MVININLHKFIFYEPSSDLKQHIDIHNTPTHVAALIYRLPYSITQTFIVCQLSKSNKLRHYNTK